MSDCNILILEDEPIIEAYLKNSFKAEPLCKISFVDSIVAAQMAIEESPPDNILLNLKLSDGWLTKDQIDFFLRDLRWNTVVITGARPCDILEGTTIHSLENINILAKPFNKFQLMRMVNSLKDIDPTQI